VTPNFIPGRARVVFHVRAFTCRWAMDQADREVPAWLRAPRIPASWRLLSIQGAPALGVETIQPTKPPAPGTDSMLLGQFWAHGGGGESQWWTWLWSGTWQFVAALETPGYISSVDCGHPRPRTASSPPNVGDFSLALHCIGGVNHELRCRGQ